VNQYRYAHSNPIGFVDPDGRTEPPASATHAAQARRTADLARAQRAARAALEAERVAMRGALLQTVNQPARQAAMATTRVFVAERLATIEAAAGPLALAAVMGAATYHLASEAEHARQAVTGSPWARLRYSRAPAVFQEMFLEMQEQGYSAEELASFTDRILAMSSEEAHERALAASRNSRSFSGTITVHGAGSSSEDDSNDETSRLIWRSVDEEDLIDLQDVGQIVPKGDVLDPVLHVQGAETAYLSASLTTRGASHFDSGLGRIGLDPELLEGTGSTILWHEDLLAILWADQRTPQTDLKNAIRHEEVLIEGGIDITAIEATEGIPEVWIESLGLPYAD
jgi:hypothetical protein